MEHFRELQDGSKQRAVVNIDDEAAAAVLQAASGVPCITFGINNAKADVCVESLDLSLWRTTVRRRAITAQHSAPQHSGGEEWSREPASARPVRAALAAPSTGVWSLEVALHACWSRPGIQSTACSAHMRTHTHVIARPALVLLQMIVATPVGRLEIITNLVGRHNVYNVLAAVAVGVLLNLPLEDIGAGIESVQFVPGRWVGWGVCWCRNRLMLCCQDLTDSRALQPSSSRSSSAWRV